MTKKEIHYLIVVFLVVTAGGTIFYFGGKATLNIQQAQKKENLADCLLLKNIKLYGSLNCPYTTKEKELFGEFFSKINYTECNNETNSFIACKEKGINTTPTWVFPKEIGIENQLLSCEECAKKSKDIYCKDYCFEESKNGTEFYVTGFMDLQTLDKLSQCNIFK
ncbi:MAG TPA: hypothetical protein PLL80_00605 [Candidatus Pacearchaeota archaeon]|nr:hypothetical protein [Candidatus Pacearchaeota archaeon]HOK94030.1 hypothetical protein [Candidatus Pacearchaeota archaeon]HPO75101.1 hypothetical protein [Candidatus Pacearchaeota archaeon]